MRGAEEKIGWASIREQHPWASNGGEWTVPDDMPDAMRRCVLEYEVSVILDGGLLCARLNVKVFIITILFCALPPAFPQYNQS